MNKIRYIILILFLLFLSSCGNSLDIITLRVGKDLYRIEVARTPEERRKGLMDRKSISGDSGMIFVFNKDRRLSFWMKNTHIPLSIAYISSDGTVKEIYSMAPESLSPVTSEHFVRYALELPAGAFQRSGVKPGDKIIIPDEIK